MTYAARRLRWKLGNLLWELRLGVTTRGKAHVDFPDAVSYDTMPYEVTMSALDRLDLAPSDVFVDIGCGKGRVLCCAAMRQVREVIGIEVSGEMCAIAKANVARMHGRRSPITVLNLDARAFDYRRGTAFFMYNPFGEATIRAVLSRIADTLPGRATPVRIAYAIPVHSAVLAESGWLEQYDCWNRIDVTSNVDHSVSFWRTRAH